MTYIHKKKVELNRSFEAPLNITFGFQLYPERGFFVWYPKDVADLPRSRYVIVPTGVVVPFYKRLLQTIVLDHEEVFHLCEVSE